MVQESSGKEAIEAKTILIVEDDVGIGELLKQVISAETPYVCVLAMDGFQALKEVRTLKPNLFILDYTSLILMALSYTTNFTYSKIYNLYLRLW
jgi:DNA-binding response OmpR family regulator